MKTITVDAFSDILLKSIPSKNDRLLRTLQKTPLSYRYLTPEEKEGTILEILKILEEPLPVSGPKRHADWEKGWDENYQALKSTGEISALLPRYYFSGKNNIMRYTGKYILPENSSFEIGFLSAIQSWLCDNIFETFDEIFEYGCGPLQNVAAFAKEFPQTRVVGLDWAEASQRIALYLSQNGLPNVEGYNFNIFDPTPDIRPSSKTAVLTFGALEQVGENFKPFLEYMDLTRPGIIVNIEPFTELYTTDTLFSYLGLKYAMKRNYLTGLYRELHAKETRGEIEILGKKTMLGNKLHDGWTFVIWRHKNSK